MHRRKRTGWLWLKLLGAVLVFLLLLVALVYAYDAPGGISDWQYSRAAGYSETLSIPIGRTPEEAVQKFRNNSNQVVHQEHIDGGVLLFLKQDEEEEHTNLRIEFVRKTWLGWKWVMGGGYGIFNKLDTVEALKYMSIPKFKGMRGPFPIIFGQVTNSIVENVFVTIEGNNAGKYETKLIQYGKGQRLWYVVLPTSSTPPYKIEALNSKKEIIASKTFDDSRDSASVLMFK